jgi:hypothetical protein
MAGDAPAAEGELAALASSGTPAPMRDWILLRRGNLLDLRGRREEALALYRQVKRGRAASAAKGFLKAPFSGGGGPRMRLFWPRAALPKDD